MKEEKIAGWFWTTAILILLVGLVAMLGGIKFGIVQTLSIINECDTYETYGSWGVFGGNPQILCFKDSGVFITGIEQEAE